MNQTHSLFPVTLFALTTSQLLHANPVDFTTDFTSGSPLNEQNNWITSGGIVLTDTGVSDNGFDSATLSNASHITGTGDEITAKITFSFSVNPDVDSAAQLLNVSFFNSSDPATASGEDLAIHNRINASVIRAGDGIRLRMYQNWGNKNPAQNGVDNVFMQTGVAQGIGLDSNGGDPLSLDGDEDLLSDTLELTMTMTAGFDEDSWSAIATLKNLTTDSVILTHARNGLSFEALNAPVFAGFGFGQGDGNAQVANRTISNFAFSYSPLSNTEARINFLATEGYTDDTLATHQSWSANGPTVDSATGLVSTTGFDHAILNTPLAFFVEGATYRASIDFTIEDQATYTPPATPGEPITDIAPPFKPLVNVGVFDQLSSFATGAGITLSFAESDGEFVTIETTAEHGLSIGAEATVTGILFSETDPNGPFVVTSVPSATSFTYALSGDDESYDVLDGVLNTGRSPQLRTGLNRIGANYNLKLQTTWSENSQSYNHLPYLDGIEGGVASLTSAPISPEAIGIERDFPTLEEADLVSDQLRMSLTLTASSTPNSWTATMDLFNLDNATPATPIASKTILNITSFCTLYGGFGDGQSDGNAAVTRSIEAFSYEVVYPPSNTTEVVSISSSNFDGTTFTINFLAAPSTSYKLASSPDLSIDFSDTGTTATTDASGVGTLVYSIPTPFSHTHIA